jgi:hypothetical protein
MTIIANEFVNFISVDDKGWINALNDIYDEDIYKYRTKNMGEDILVGPYTVLLGALTNEVATDMQSPTLYLLALHVARCSSMENVVGLIHTQSHGLILHNEKHGTVA